MRRVSPELRLLLRVPARVGVRSSELAPSSRLPVDEPDVVGDACDGAACGGSSGIKNQPSCVGGSTEVSSSISNARREGVGAVGGEVGVGSEKDQLRSLTEALPRKDAPE